MDTWSCRNKPSGEFFHCTCMFPTWRISCSGGVDANVIQITVCLTGCHHLLWCITDASPNLSLEEHGNVFATDPSVLCMDVQLSKVLLLSRHSEFWTFRVAFFKYIFHPMAPFGHCPPLVKNESCLCGRRITFFIEREWRMDPWLGFPDLT